MKVFKLSVSVVIGGLLRDLGSKVDFGLWGFGLLGLRVFRLSCLSRKDFGVLGFRV